MFVQSLINVVCAAYIVSVCLDRNQNIYVKHIWPLVPIPVSPRIEDARSHSYFETGNERGAYEPSYFNKMRVKKEPLSLLLLSNLRYTPVNDISIGGLAMSIQLLTGNLVLMGLCYGCKQHVEIVDPDGDCVLSKHTNQAGELCRRSGYDANEIAYRIDTSEQALSLARVIADDTSVCLGDLYDGTCHTIACGDGRDCAEERNRRAKALAHYLVNVLSP